MEKRETKTWAVNTLVALLALSSGFFLQAAEGKQISGKDTYERTIARIEIFPNDAPHHRLIQQVNLSTTESNDPDFDNVSATTYEQTDGVEKGGKNKGYRIQRHENGDETYVQYEGSYTLSEKKEGVYEWHSEGKWELTGGTGKFKNIKGAGTYKSTGTAEEGITEWTGEVEY
jgi:hypothetical protein